MKPASDVALFFIDEQGVLFSESAQKLYRLNEVATYVWCLLEDERDKKSILPLLQKTYRIDNEEAGEMLDQTFQLFARMHVLDGTQKAEVFFEGDPVLDIAVPEVSFVAERFYRLLESIIRIRFSSVEQLYYIETVFKHLVCLGEKKADIIIDIIIDNDTHILCRDGLPYNVCPSLSNLGPMAKALLWAAALNNYQYFINVHAGVVGDGNVCYLFPAKPGGGKSTLMAALAHHGFEFFSDEMALLERDSFMVGPTPLAICIKNTGIEPLLSYYPELSSEISHQRGDKKVVQYVSPPVASVPDQSVRRPIAAIIFPQYMPDITTQIKPIDTLDALQRLAEQFLVVTTHLDKQAIADLIEWLEKMPCYELSVSDTDEAIELIKTLADAQ